MKLFVTGVRGFPGIFLGGGDETHGEQLHTQLAKQGIDVVARRKPYETKANRSASFDGVRFVDICAPRDKHFEAIILIFLAIIKIALISNGSARFS